MEILPIVNEVPTENSLLLTSANHPDMTEILFKKKIKNFESSIHRRVYKLAGVSDIDSSAGTSLAAPL